MSTFAPSYYKKFQCIADKCRHSCCIGWEIDIDNKSYDLYKQHNGILKHRFEMCIADDDNPHFILDKNERCPFLNKNNLCDIYTEMGESALCQICTDHPRFRNFYENCTEIGLGICCEEACKIILLNEEYFRLECIEEKNEAPLYTDHETEIIALRNEVVSALQNRNKSVFERFEDIWRLIGINISEFELKDIFTELEYMEQDISSMLGANNANIPDIYLEQIAVYFIYRYLSDSLNDGMTAERIIFAYISIKAICSMCRSSDFEEICENARIYSSEIEYSEENMEEILYRLVI